MKLAIYTRYQDEKVEIITDILDSLSVNYSLNPESLDSNFSAILTFGGDGTLLDAARQLSQSATSSELPPLLGINGGRLGFLATVSLEDARDAIENIIEGNFELENRAMLEINSEGSLHDAVALNEFTAQRKGVSMVEIEIKINGAEVASYWADGVIVSTPTGSTAYSMSVGGSIIAPDARCFIISPVAPHNLSLRPLVVSDESVIEIGIKSRFDEGAIITVDNLQYSDTNNHHFVINKCKKPLQLIKFNNSNFYSTLREKLHWAVDIRGVAKTP